MWNSQVSCQKIDLILTILVACLANVSTVVRATSVAITPPVTTDNGRDGYQALGPDIGADSTNKPAGLIEAAGQRLSSVTDYSILSLRVQQTSGPSSDALPDRVNATAQDTESILTTANPQAPSTAATAAAAAVSTTTTTTTTSTRILDSQQTTQISQQQLLASLPHQNHCTLGDDTYQIGERWNPNLPPFGIQVCVLCECTVRQRKSCYESKVTCRRIINECPVIDSCPDGKKPVTVAGQCCKSCQSAGSVSSPLVQDGPLQVQQQQQQQQQIVGNQSLAYDSRPLLARPYSPTLTQTSFKIVYMNERMKEYMALVKSLPACPTRDTDFRPSPPLSSTTTQPSQISQAPKAPKGSRNDLNGIDTRLAFKSLHDSVPSYLGASNHRAHPSESTQLNQQQPATRRFDHSADDQQHPNDVQSASSNNNLHQNNPPSGSTEYRAHHQLASPSNCVLGNDTFRVGDIWNPILPPFGVQVCVQCNCIFRIRRGCYETKVTCRRINRDCPVIDVCPDGKLPISLDGQCCKTCSTSSGEEQDTTDITSNTTTLSTSTMRLNGIQRNEKIHREFQSLSKNLNVCVKLRESVDIYNTNRYARKSRQT